MRGHIINMQGPGYNVIANKGARNAKASKYLGQKSVRGAHMSNKGANRAKIAGVGLAVGALGVGGTVAYTKFQHAKHGTRDYSEGSAGHARSSAAKRTLKAV